MRIKGARIDPRPIPKDVSLTTLVRDYFPAYNGARFAEACRLFTDKILRPDVTVGLSISGALTPAGFGTSIFAPMIRSGFVDYIVSTGANLYHDLHYALDLPLHRSSPFVDDRELKKRDIVRIYDIVFDFDVLLSTDKFCYRMLQSKRFEGRMSSAELHYRMGSFVARAERQLGRPYPCLLSAAYRAKVPIYTSSPGDSTIGLNIAAKRFRGLTLDIDASADVNETTAIVYGAARSKRRSAVLILGGGSPKNFLLQTKPQLHEILGLDERGHDYFIQITDARPDTGGLSGATPSEAVSWGKVDPHSLPDSVVCYADCSLALPLLAAYAFANAKRRPLKRLYKKRELLVTRLARAYDRIRLGGRGEPKRKKKKAN